MSPLQALGNNPSCVTCFTVIFSCKVYLYLGCYSPREPLGVPGALCPAGGCGPALRVGGDRHVGVCFPGSSPVTGPKAVRGQERGSLAVQCRYTPGWESHGKWWCRGADWSSCKILVQTTASEPEVKRDRVSIRDDRENRTFTVTTEELRLDDAGIYWCGIARVGTDHGAQVRVTVDPGKSMCVCGCVSQGLLCPGPRGPSPGTSLSLRGNCPRGCMSPEVP